MNIQHSSRTDAWGTPEDILESVRKVLGSIELDPASDEHFNQFVRAQKFITEEENGLSASWETYWAPTTGPNIFLNPPGGKIANKSKTQLFWNRLMQQRALGRVNHAIFMGFSLECLQTTQSSSKSALDFPLCVPRKRIKFVAKNGTYNAPSHSNVIIYVPGHVDCTSDFIAEFSKYGKCKP